MYTKEQVSLLKESFWRTFGQKMSSVPSDEGLKIKWINYDTGIRHLFFKMDADSKHCIIMIEIANPDHDIHELLYQQFEEVKHLLEEELSEEWTWVYKLSNERGRPVSRIFTTLEGVNLFKPEDQPKIYRFLRERLIALDRFWCNANAAFEDFKD